VKIFSPTVKITKERNPIERWSCSKSSLEFYTNSLKKFVEYKISNFACGFFAFLSCSDFPRDLRRTTQRAYLASAENISSLLWKAAFARLTIPET